MKSKSPIIAVIGGALIVMMVLLGTIFHVGPFSTDPADADGGRVPDEVCATPENLHYYAYDTPDAKFGPAVQPSKVEKVLEELHNRRCADPALVVAHREYADRVYGSPEQRIANTVGIAGNREAWLTNLAYLELRESKAVKVEIREISTDNQSMWMLDTKPVPTIIKGPSDVTTFHALVFVYADGTEDVYKLDCGFQPMAPDFPGVPEKPTCVENCTPPPCVENCTPPPCVENCKPPTDFDCQQNGIGCPPGVTIDVIQPVQENPSGVDIGRTRDGDGNPVVEPPIQQDRPANNRDNPAPAPAPTETGSNSGSPTGSGTPSGSTSGGGSTNVGGNDTGPAEDTGQGGDNDAPIAPPD